MCFYLTVAVPKAQGEQVHAVFGETFEARPTANASVMAALPAGYDAWVVTNGTCSCDLYASLVSPPMTEDERQEQLRKKYARRGWSAAKIARAVEQAMNDRPARPPGL